MNSIFLYFGKNLAKGVGLLFNLIYVHSRILQNWSTLYFAETCFSFNNKRNIFLIIFILHNYDKKKEKPMILRWQRMDAQCNNLIASSRLE
jgi:hypothetical protein